MLGISCPSRAGHQAPRLPPVVRGLEIPCTIFAEFFDEQAAHAAGLVVHLPDHFFRQATPRLLPHQVADLAPGQAGQGQPGLMVHRGPRWLELGAEGEQGQDSVVQELGDELSQEFQSGRVHPVQILKDMNRTCESSKRSMQPLLHEPESSPPFGGWWQRERRKTGRESVREELMPTAAIRPPAGPGRTASGDGASGRTGPPCLLGAEARGHTRRSRWLGAVPCSGSVASSALLDDGRVYSSTIGPRTCSSFSVWTSAICRLDPLAGRPAGRPGPSPPWACARRSLSRLDLVVTARKPAVAQPVAAFDQAPDHSDPLRAEELGLIGRTPFGAFSGAEARHWNRPWNRRWGGLGGR